MNKEEIEQWIKEHPKEAEMVVKGMTDALMPIIDYLGCLAPILMDALKPLFDELDKALQIVLENEDITLEEFINHVKKKKEFDGEDLEI